jgi:hypothetical protein
MKSLHLQQIKDTWLFSCDEHVSWKNMFSRFYTDLVHELVFTCHEFEDPTLWIFNRYKLQGRSTCIRAMQMSDICRSKSFEIDSEDDSSDDETLSFESKEFIGKGLWTADQENAQKTSHKHTYVRFPKRSLGLSGIK